MITRWTLFFCLTLSSLFADTLALYLSWYDDPTTTMTIQWHTPREESNDLVSLQLPNGKWKMAEGSHIDLDTRFVHTVRLEKLSPDTEYFFRVGKETESYKFRTAPKDLSHPIRFCIGGDLYHTIDLFRKMSQTVAEQDPLFAVLGGDIAYALNKHPLQWPATEKKQWFDFFKAWKELMMTKEGRVIPFIAIPGNHDIRLGDEGLWFKLMAFPSKHLYRSVDFGNYLRLICLDSDHFEKVEGVQTEWLKETLSNSGAFPYRFAIYHVAAYPSYYPFKGKISDKIRANWCSLFNAYPLTAVFENHNHTYKKTFPIQNNEISDKGTIYFGDGCWGALPRVTAKHKYLEKGGRENHVYLIDLDEASAKIQAIDIHGKILDVTELPADRR